MRHLLLVLISMLLATGALGQPTPPPPPANNACADATVVQPGQTLTGLSNATCSVAPGPETPGIMPTTCIKSLENDLWFQFTTVKGLDQYVVTIGHGMCTTPAGLQALLIRSDDCDSAHYVYAGCSNLMATDTIKLFLRDTTPGRHYLIYVDGFDGTVCDFSLSLKGRNSEFVSMDDYKYIRYDYDNRSTPVWMPEGLETQAGSNKVNLKWTGSNQEDVAFYVVEGMHRHYRPGESPSQWATVLSVIPSKGSVSGQAPEYQFTAYPSSEEERDYCYRIVKVSTKGTKSFCEPFCVHLKPITSFYVGEVLRGNAAGQYTVTYINHLKKETFTLEVLNAANEVVKQTQLKDEPVRDGTVTINMLDFPKGLYQLRMTNRKGEAYVREFEVF